MTLSDVTKMSLRTPYPLYTCTQIKVLAQVCFQMSYAVPIVSASELCFLNLHLRHLCTFADTQTRVFSIFTLLLSITNASLPLVFMTVFSNWNTL